MPFSKLRTHPHLYEINTWAWLEGLSAKAGRRITLADVPDAEWDAIAQRGFDIVWLMGLWQRSEESRQIVLADPGNRAQYDRVLPGWKPEDVIGSPYAVKDYVPDPRIGNWESLDRVREKLHARGMALFSDFVGNHTALDHPWTSEHPEYYVQGSEEDFAKDPGAFFKVSTRQGEKYIARAHDLYCPPWRDAAQLNYFHPATREAQIGVLHTLASHCDGARCDMAMLQLTDIFEKIWTRNLHGAPAAKLEFWEEASAAVPRLTLLAEVYWGTEQRLLDLGFSFAYDKDLYDAVKDSRAGDIQVRLQASVGYQSRLARFLENHDEERRAAVFPNARLSAAGTLMGTLPGMRFYHQGELEGLRNHLPITLRIAAPEPPDAYCSSFFEKILRLTNEEVFHRGRWSLLDIAPEGDATFSNLIGYEWRTENSWKLIVVNMAQNTSQGRVKLGDRARADRSYSFHDELNEVVYPREGRELHDVGLYVRLDAGQAHIFDIKPA